MFIGHFRYGTLRPASVAHSYPTYHVLLFKGEMSTFLVRIGLPFCLAFHPSTSSQTQRFESKNSQLFSTCPTRLIGDVTLVRRSLLLLATSNVPSVTIANAALAATSLYELDYAIIKPAFPRLAGLTHRILVTTVTQARLSHLQVNCAVKLFLKSRIDIQGQSRRLDRPLAPTYTPAVNALRKGHKSGSRTDSAPGVVIWLVAVVSGISEWC